MVEVDVAADAASLARASATHSASTPPSWRSLMSAQKSRRTYDARKPDSGREARIVAETVLMSPHLVDPPLPVISYRELRKQLGADDAA